MKRWPRVRLPAARPSTVPGTTFAPSSAAVAASASATSVGSDFKASPPRSTCAAGQGLSPLMRAASSRAGAAKSSAASSFVSLRQKLAAVSS